MCAHRLPSVPAWTALPPRAQTEESEDSASSHDMHDELDEPGPSSPARPQLGSKRKDEGKRRQSTGKHKKRRISERINVFNDEDDIPASAHAAPVRKPASTLPSRPRPPVFRVPNVVAARRTFEDTHGPMPSSSASQLEHAADPNPPDEAAPPPRPRNVARKSAAIPPPGQRRNRGLRGLGTSASRASPPATAPPEPMHAGSPTMTEQPRPQQEAIRKKLRAIPRSRARRRKTTGDSIACIEISDSEEERPTRTSRFSLPGNLHRTQISTEVIELTDSEEELTAPASAAAFIPNMPIVIDSSDSEDGELPAAIHSTEDPRPQDDITSLHSPMQDDFDDIDTNQLPVIEETPRAPSTALGHEENFPLFPSDHHLSSIPAAQDNSPLPPESSDSGLAGPSCIQNLPSSVDDGGFGQQHEYNHVSDRSPSLLPARPPSSAEVQDPEKIDSSSRPPEMSTAYEAFIARSPVGQTSPGESLSVVASPSSSGGVETLVPALDDMALVSSSTSAASDSPLPRNYTDTPESQSTDPFNAGVDRHRNDASLTHSTSVLDEHAESEVPMDEVPQDDTVFAHPVTPPRGSAILDLNFKTIQSSKKKRRSSRSSRKFSFTPIVLSPASPPSFSASAPVAIPSRSTESPLSPSLSRKQWVGTPPEVRGHLYGDEGGFFKAVFKNKSPNEARKKQFSQADSPTRRISLTAPISSHANSAYILSAPPLMTSPEHTVEPELSPFASPSLETEKPECPSPFVQAEHPHRHATPEHASESPSAPPQPSSSEAEVVDVPVVEHALVAAASMIRPKKPTLPIPRINRSLANTIAKIQLERATQQGQFIDLTLDDSEPEDTPMATEPLVEPFVAHDEPEGHIISPQSVDAQMASRSVSPASAGLPITVCGTSQHAPEIIPSRIGTSPAVTHDTLQGDNGDHDEASVRDMLLDSNRSSPDPLDTFATHGRRRSTRILRRLASRSNSASSVPVSRMGSPSLVLSRRSGIPGPHEEYLRVSGVTRALIRRMRDVSDASSEEDDGMSWATYGKILMHEYANIRWRARDLPHRIEDYMNTLPPWMRQIPGYERTIFKAIIRGNTADQEPDAPEIDIINNVDSDPCPPFEFYYTNYMWHSDSVPQLDASKLKGCGCYPVCLPDSHCSCLKRQQEFYDESMSGFNYHQGRLKYEEYPIFECNALCGCDESCSNRVVQHGRKHALNIEKTKEKGWGIVAAQRIPAKTFVGIYAGEFITDIEGETRGKIYHLGSRTYLFDIDFWHLKKGKVDWDVKYCVDAFHAGNFTRYLNHSCEPNCCLVPVYINEPDLEKPMLAIFTSKDVHVNQELCFSYFGSVDDDEEQERAEPQLQDDIFIACKCGSKKCTGRIWKS